MSDDQIADSVDISVAEQQNFMQDLVQLCKNQQQQQLANQLNIPSKSHLNGSHIQSLDRIGLTQSQSVFCKALPYDAFNLESAHIKVKDAIDLFKKHMVKKHKIKSNNGSKIKIKTSIYANSNYAQVLSDSEDYGIDQEEHKGDIQIPGQQASLITTTNTMGNLQAQHNNRVTLTIISNSDSENNPSREPLIITKEQLGASIGASKDNIFQLLDSQKRISRHHCQILYSEQKSCFSLYDLGSTSGTFIRLNKHEVKTGDIIELGVTELLVKGIVLEPGEARISCQIAFSEQADMINQEILFVVEKDRPYEIGRSEQCDYVIRNDKKVQKVHFKFFYNFNQLLLIDNRTEQGTWRRLSPIKTQSDQILLKNEMVIKIIPYIIKVSLTGSQQQ